MSVHRVFDVGVSLWLRWDWALHLSSRQLLKAAAIITIDDRREGIPELEVAGVPLGVPGIQNVIRGNEFISFTYDDLVPAETTRTREIFLREIVRLNDLEVGYRSGISDVFIWSVVQGSSAETVNFFLRWRGQLPTTS